MRSDWKQSIFSDGTVRFVSNPTPGIGEEVRVRVRMFKDCPVSRVFVKLLLNGEQRFISACLRTQEQSSGSCKVLLLLRKP